MAIRFSTRQPSAPVPAKGGASAPPAADVEKTAALAADDATDLFEPDAGKQTGKAKARKRK